MCTSYNGAGIFIEGLHECQISSLVQAGVYLKMQVFTELKVEDFIYSLTDNFSFAWIISEVEVESFSSEFSFVDVHSFYVLSLTPWNTIVRVYLSRDLP